MRQFKLKTALLMFGLSTSGMISGCSEQKSVSEIHPIATVEAYPETRKDTTVTDTYFGTIVPDPYRWLEDDNSEETTAWVEAQNKVTQSFLDQIPFRDTLRQRIEELWDYEKVGKPLRKEGNIIILRMMVFKTRVFYMLLNILTMREKCFLILMNCLKTAPFL